MRTSKKFRLSIVAFCCAAVQAMAVTYYASPDGMGSGESADDPCSLSEGVKKIEKQASTLVLAAGRYFLGGEPVALTGIASTTEQTVIKGETGIPADVVLDAQGASEVMRMNYSVLIDGVTMLNGSNNPYTGNNSSQASKHPAAGVRISYTGNSYGPSIVSNCVIACCTNNYSDQYNLSRYTAAVAVYGNGLLVDSVVSNNVALRYYGGGVVLRDGAQVRRCTIAGNKADNGGAGVFCDTNATAIVADSVISNNVVTHTRGSGGGLDCRLAGASLMLTNCTFVGNTATVGAGLAASGDVEVKCMDCKFVGNTASGQGGGVRLAETAVVSLYGCEFDGNRQTEEKYSPNANVTASADYAGGGGVFVQTQSGDGFVSISNCVFRNNSTGSRGGGFGHTWMESVYGEIVNCRFLGNSSRRQGGGAVLREETVRTDRPFVIRNCLFAFNRTTGTGNIDSSGAGLHFVSKGNPVLDFCTIVSNDSGRAASSGGIHHRYGGTVKNSIVAFNTRAGEAESGTGWCLVDPNNTSVLVPSAYVNCCAWPAAEGAFLAANGCVNADPKFRDASSGDFALRATSPCRDTGVNEPWMSTLSDLVGNRRIAGSMPDMGCYEFVPRAFAISFR